MRTPFYFYPLFKFSVPEEIKNACFKDSTLISFNVVKMFGAFHFRGPTEGFVDLSGHSNASDLPTSTLDSCKSALVWRWCCFAKQMPTWSHRYFCGSIRLSWWLQLGLQAVLGVSQVIPLSQLITQLHKCHPKGSRGNSWWGNGEMWHQYLKPA